MRYFSDLYWIGLMALIPALGLPDEAWQNNHLPYLPFRDTGPLSGEDLWDCQSALSDLDANDYDRRETAQEKLLSFGLRAWPFVMAAKIEAEGSENSSLEVIIRLNAIVNAMPDADRKIIEAYFKDQRKRAPFRYESPDPESIQRMARRISFSWQGLPLLEILARLERHTGVPIAIDPEVEDPNLRIHLRITDMPSDVALTWVCRLSSCDWIYHRSGILVGAARVREIGTMVKTVTLDRWTGGPWSNRETRQWCALLSPRPVDGIPWACEHDVPDVDVHVAGPGILEVRGTYKHLLRFDDWLAQARKGWAPVEERFPEVKAWVAARRRTMGRVFKDEPLSAALRKALEGLDAEWRVHPEIAAKFPRVTCLDANTTLGRWLQSTCASNKWVLVPDRVKEKWQLCLRTTSDGVYLDASAVIPYAMDLTHADTKEPENQLKSILLSSPLPCSGVRLRNRYLGFADVWTVLRMEECIKPSSGRIGGLK